MRLIERVKRLEEAVFKTATDNETTTDNGKLDMKEAMAKSAIKRLEEENTELRMKIADLNITIEQQEVLKRKEK